MHATDTLSTASLPHPTRSCAHLSDRVGMLSICAVLMMIASEFFLGSENGLGLGSSMLHRWRTATAGAIASAASLVLLLMAVGTE